MGDGDFSYPAERRRDAMAVVDALQAGALANGVLSQRIKQLEGAADAHHNEVRADIIRIHAKIDGITDAVTRLTTLEGERRVKCGEHSAAIANLQHAYDQMRGASRMGTVLWTAGSTIAGVALTYLGLKTKAGGGH